MKESQTNQAPLELNVIWNNLLLKLCGMILGKGVKTDYFIVRADDDYFKIIRAANQEGLRPYTAEEAAWNYDAFMFYLTGKGVGSIAEELCFIQDTVMYLCMLKLYLGEKSRGGRTVDETLVLKLELAQYMDTARTSYIKEYIRRYLSAYYAGLERENALEVLAVAILRTLCLASAREPETAFPVKCGEDIRRLQDHFVSQMEEYLDTQIGEEPPVIDVPLISDWEYKWFTLRETLTADCGIAEDSDLITALDNTYWQRVKDITMAALGDTSDVSPDIPSVRAALKKEMGQLDQLLERIDQLK